VPNVAALRLGSGGPRELVFSLGYHNSTTTPYAEMLASLTINSKVLTLTVSGSLIEFSQVLAKALRANTLVELKNFLGYISFDEWKLLFETIAASTLKVIWIGYIFNSLSPIQITEASFIVANAIRTNRCITHLKFNQEFRNEDV
jgi:hypothetical protein